MIEIKKNAFVFGKLVFPIIFMVSSILWFYFTDQFNFEVISNTLSILALYYFFISIYEYFKKDNS